MINEGTIAGVKKASEDLNILLVDFLTSIQQVEQQEKNNERTSDIIRQRETALLQKQGKLAEDQKDIERQKKIIGDDLHGLDARRQELKTIEKQMEDKRTFLRKEIEDMDKKKTELQVFISQKTDLTEREQELDKKRKELNEREALNQKETLILRQRKETLDSLEHELTTEKQRIKNLLHI